MVFRFATFDPAQDPDDFNPAFPPTPSPSPPSVTLCQPCEYTYTFTKTMVRRLVAAGASLVLTTLTSEFHDDEIRGQYAGTPFDGINIDAHPEFHQRQLKEFTLKELEVATQNFSNKKTIGMGGFGTVYEGRLADGSLVAIKRMRGCRRQAASEFEREVMVGSIVIPHHNLLPLLGFSRAQKCKYLLLVSPLMINKSLDCYLTEHLDGRTPLDWATRRKIALGAARGLRCLHDLNIVHLDIKPSNIMLDEEFEPRIGDFGLVKFTDPRCGGYSVDGIKGALVLPRNESEAGSHSEDFYRTNKICGTIGYMPPEYMMHGEYSAKTDVFAFGITLLQLVTGRLDAVNVYDQSKLVWLVDWLREFVVEGRWESGVDPNLQGEYDREETEKVIRLALLCTQEAPRTRPSMAQVVRILEGHSIEERWKEYCRSDEYLFRLSQPPTLYQSEASSLMSSEELSGPR